MIKTNHSTFILNSKLNLRSANLTPQTIVLLRLDLNTPLKQRGSNIVVADQSRLLITLPTINYLLEKRAKIIICSHLGRPQNHDPNLSLAPVAESLSNLIGKKITLVSNYYQESQICKNAKRQILSALNNDQIVLLENLRFYQEEKACNLEFGQALAKLADIFVNDAFSNSHRSDASMIIPTKVIPSYFGFAIEQELTNLSPLLQRESIRRPFVVILGGGKTSDKIQTLGNLLNYADYLLLGGQPANQFLEADGIETHQSLNYAGYKSQEEHLLYRRISKKILNNWRFSSLLQQKLIPLPKIIYPIDALAKLTLTNEKNFLQMRLSSICKNSSNKNAMIIDLINYPDYPTNLPLQYSDIGPKTIKLYQTIVEQAQTIFWNGPMGTYEQTLFSQGTKAIIKAISQQTKKGATTIAGGGNTIEIIKRNKMEKDFSYLSTAGSACFQFLGEGEMPGLKMFLLTK